LMHAVARGHVEIVKKLIEAGADISIKGEEGKRAKDYLKAGKGRSEIADLLKSGVAKTGEKARKVKKSRKESLKQGLRIRTQKGVRKYLCDKWGVSLEKMPGIRGAYFVSMADTSASSESNAIDEMDAIIQDAVPVARGVGLVLIRCMMDSRFGSGLSLLKAVDKFEVISKMGLHSNRCAISNDEVVEFVRELDSNNEFELLGCSDRILTMRFTGGIKVPENLAKAIIDFCPEVMEGFDLGWN